MGYIKALKAEIEDNPAIYSALSNKQCADSLNDKSIERNLTSLLGSQIWEATNAGEYDALADPAKDQWLALCKIVNVDPFGPAADVAISIFGGGSQTIIALSALRVEQVSRSTELGFQKVREGHVEMARAI